MCLRIAHLEQDIRQALAGRQVAGAGDHPSIDIDPQRIATGSDPRRLSCGLASPAADVQHTVCALPQGSTCV
jgi:hypothetical protein